MSAGHKKCLKACGNSEPTDLPPDYSIRAEETSTKAAVFQQPASGRHQIFTVLTILLGVSAPALVTVNKGGWWQVVAIVVTAFATAAATIRTVLRFGERYSNSALTSIALLDADAQVNAKKEEVLITVKPEYKDQKLFEVAAWARRQTFEIMKGYIEKDVSATTTERMDLVAPPKIEDHQKADPTKK